MRSCETDAYAYLTITSKTHPLDDITLHMRVSPDRRSWSKGDDRHVPNRLRPKYEFSRWSLASGVSEGEGLNAHFAGLCRRMEPLRQQLKTLPNGMNAYISCTGWAVSDTDSVQFEAGVLRDIGGFGMSFDFDLYSENG
ncbi:DUF4279 domain-containing protein [Alisedimentitalea sp. MJ-SS2]|uniref:DUF4279 domain-containing protein n=1 Tax=Aliisedimentitalea sp. MJ-SS2 TaxID=3049795 RepID=UPI00290A101C|nr:DUF4279 domain-containing protein [Alisedimentitalea sp. MJ-SS2]MDU8926830.1 DUF4279 domain-containing protein [Alisedimentitalea sp. MJ-SS2]